MTQKNEELFPGKTTSSWKKHDLLLRAAQGQAHMYRYRHAGRIAIVDTHSGDGNGVPRPQYDFFDGNTSLTTARIALKIAKDVGNADVILCESNFRRREKLKDMFPETTVVHAHGMIKQHIHPETEWVLVLNDPNGFGGHGITCLQSIAAEFPSDFLVTFNEGSWKRLMAIPDSHRSSDIPVVRDSCHSKDTYGWMGDFPQWARMLSRRHMAISPLFKPSPNFWHRIFVIADYLSSDIKPPRYERIV